MIAFATSVWQPRRRYLSGFGFHAVSLQPQRTTQPHHRLSKHRITYARAEDASNTEDEVLDVCKDLEQQCKSQLHLFQRDAPELFEDAQRLASELETSSRSGFDVSKRFKDGMVGNWRLALTDSKAIVKNAGSIIGLPSPGSRCVSIDIILDRNGKATTRETFETLFGGLKWTNALHGTWELTGKRSRTLEVTYAEAALFGNMRLRADSKAVLETTYCGRKVRIGRSASGDVYIFARLE